MELSESEPRLAEVAHDRLITPGVLLVATVRRDGTPRLSPVEPLIVGADLWLSMMWQSHKAIDLLRDDRMLIHSIITTPDGSEGEVKDRRWRRDARPLCRQRRPACGPVAEPRRVRPPRDLGDERRSARGKSRLLHRSLAQTGPSGAAVDSARSRP